MKRIIFSNYHHEEDEHGKNNYDYARDFLWDEDTEHKFTYEDYVGDQLQMVGLERFTCPVCGKTYASLTDAKECCRDQKWETKADIPDDLVKNIVYLNEEADWNATVSNMDAFIKSQPRGLILWGSKGLWNCLYRGGCFVRSFDDLRWFWEDCDYIKIYDEDGRLCIECLHHDGMNDAEIRLLTPAGELYKDRHCMDFEADLYIALFNNEKYTRDAHYFGEE